MSKTTAFIMLFIISFQFPGINCFAQAVAQPAADDPEAATRKKEKDDADIEKLKEEWNNVNWNPLADKSSKTEKIVTMGSQTWMGENLNVSSFRNGDAIAEIKTDAEWEKAYDNKKPAWCYYNNDAANGAKYGKLYNWWAVVDSRGLAPSGWRVPTTTDWNTLTSALGTEAAKKLKSTSGWNNGGNGISQNNFSALPGGFRETAPDSFGEIGNEGYWWTSSINNVMGFDLGAGLLLKYNSNEPDHDSYAAEGMSVRCIK